MVKRWPSVIRWAVNKLESFLPPFLVHRLRKDSRGLIAAERRFQRQFLKDYNNQVKLVAPELRARGEFCGTMIIDYFNGKSSLHASYASSIQSTSADTDDDAAVQQALERLEPFITPALNPFVEGVQTPILAECAKIERDVKRLLVLTAVASVATGFALGRAASRSSSRSNH
ncbi:hypothetical protein FVE85_4926 [Porphyridium purpureum]|uniref:Uncharacterized protein n=1 Tax=Porphyridium purpureum TaxID=35688 RepID=A0A5J4YQQ2_PORPP|nr:hypothetical protein FVE85_4926 [Porphyridium purpureum]|eukprot:POR7341..scf236_6